MATTTNVVRRITKAERYTDIIALLSGGAITHGTTTEIAVEFIKNEMSLLAKKNSSEHKKPTAKQLENEEYKTQILAFLTTQTEGKTCTEIANSIPALSDFSTSKTSALMRQLIDAEKVTKEIIKGKSLFSLA